ncbi:MAG: aromatic ring-opening dioxygenase subunit LigA [Pseudomonadota bacterium]
MSLYYVQKLMFEMNRDSRIRAQFLDDPDGILKEYELTDEERQALLEPDIGLLYVLGVNGQILMHYAAAHAIAWDDYLERMREGLRQHGPVRAGVYAATGYEGIDAHSERLGQHAEDSTSGGSA